MPFEFTGWALKGLTTRHFMVLIPILLISVEAKSRALRVGTSDEILRTLHHSPVERQTDLLESPHIQYLHQHGNWIGLIAVLGAAGELEDVDVAPGLWHVQVFNRRNRPIDQTVVAQDAQTLETLVCNLEPWALLCLFTILLCFSQVSHRRVAYRAGHVPIQTLVLVLVRFYVFALRPLLMPHIIILFVYFLHINWEHIWRVSRFNFVIVHILYYNTIII